MNQSSDKLVTLNTERDHIKLQKLLRIKQNIESLAQKDAQKFHQAFKKSEKREKLAREYKRAIQEEAKMKKQKLDGRRLQAKDLVVKAQLASEQKGVKIYAQYVKDIEERMQQEKQREKQMSFAEYEAYKKKFESSINNTSFFMERMKENEKDTEKNLDELDYKLNRGYDRSVMHRSEKIQRASYYTEKI